MRCFITIGLPASGKSTWAREYISQNPNTVRINNDEIRNGYYEAAGNRNWSAAVEDYVRKSREEAVRYNAQHQRDIIVDNTHLNTKTLRQITELCKSLGYEVETVDFRHVPLEECIQRDAARKGHEHVGEAVIRRMYNKFAQKDIKVPLPRRQAEPGLPTAVIVDIDGTLAEMGDRGPYDEHLVYADPVREHVLITVDALRLSAGAKVLIMSGRSEQCRAETVRWLQDRCGMPVDSYQLWMRTTDDRRRDSIVKRELYEQHVAGRYNILAVFDDRQQVIRECWAQLNLPVFRCGVIDHDDF